jgi:hypothetical protein
MSSIWTPGGERPVNRGGGEPPAGAAPGLEDLDGGELTAAQQQQLENEMRAMQEELANTPAAVVIANHAVGLFQLAAIHLNQRPPHLDDGRLAIDAFAALLDGLQGRLGEEETALRQGLDQLRMAYVQLSGGGSDEEA